MGQPPRRLPFAVGASFDVEPFRGTLMSQPGPSQTPRPVVPVPYAGVATPRDALMTGSASRAILVGGILLRLIGAYTLVECRRPVAQVLQDAFDLWGQMDFGFGWFCLVAAGYVTWGVLMLLRGPRFLERPLRRALAASAADGAEWSVVALCVGGAVILLWTMDPLLSLFSTRGLLGGVPATLAQLVLGIWLFLFAGRLSSVRPWTGRR